VLSLFDLPVGRDMDGQPLTGIYEHPPTIRFIDSWDDVPGEAALLDRSAEVGSEAAAAVVRQLADLGYIDHVPENLSEAIDQTIREQRWNLARALVDGDRLDEAVGILAELWDRWPDEGRFGVALFNARLDLGQLPEARETLQLLFERKQAAMRAAVEPFEKLLAKIRAEQGLPAVDLKASGDGDEKNRNDLFEGVDLAKLSEDDSHQLRKLRGRVTLNPRTFAFLEASLLAAERRHEPALAALDRAAGVETSLEPSLRLKRAEVLLAMRRAADAHREYAAVIAIDPLNAAAHFGRGRAAFLEGDFAAAAAAAQAAIGCRLQFPRAHLLAGRALWRAGRVQEAERFLRTAVAQEPLFPAGQRLLAVFLFRVRGDLAAAVEHRRLAIEGRRLLRDWRAGIRPEDRHVVELRQSLGQPQPAGPRPEFRAAAAECVTVVTGLPRSGTSMMMQMLAAGGLPVLADDRRLADESNPRGYLEFEPVKRLVREKAWLGEAVGKAVKIVSPLVTHLPRDATAKPYLVVVMRRPVAEIVASQRAMLERTGRAGSELPDDALAGIYERQAVNTRTFLAHLESIGRAKVLDIAYHAAVADPRGTAERLAGFFSQLADGKAFDVAAAAAAVEAGLHRVRRAETAEATPAAVSHRPDM
jgi:tetratricopeptide (TPR) repeat protein